MNLSMERRSMTTSSSKLRLMSMTAWMRAGSMGLVNTRSFGKTVVMSSIARVFSKAKKRPTMSRSVFSSIVSKGGRFMPVSFAATASIVALFSVMNSGVTSGAFSRRERIMSNAACGKFSTRFERR